MRTMCKSVDGWPVTQPEQSLLEDAIFEGLLRGEDVSNLIGIKRAHNRRPSDPIRIALHYLCLTKLMHEKAVVAWRTVGDAWGLKKRDVQRVIADNWTPALAMLPQFAATPARRSASRPTVRRGETTSRVRGVVLRKAALKSSASGIAANCGSNRWLKVHVAFKSSSTRLRTERFRHRRSCTR